MDDLSAKIEQNGVFTDAYWKLHRNALFFAAFTFLLSIPDVKIDSSATGYALKIGATGGRAICWAIFSTSIYSTSVFIFEWLQQAFPYLKNRYAFFQDFLKQDSDNLQRFIGNISDISNSVENCAAQVSNFYDRTENTDQFFQTGFINLPLSASKPPTIKPILAWHSRSIEELKDIARQEADKIYLQNLPNTIVNIGSQIDRYSEKLEEDLANFAQLHDERIRNYSRGNAAAIFAEAQKKIESLNSIDFKINSLTKWIGFRARLIRAIAFFDIVRVIGFGLMLPTALFLIASAHFIGKFVIHIFNSTLL